ncbi:MAG: repressor LexA, partial [Planctomycetes bacterium]|nr:repressor LexA [Planctomycetota bacterium]
APHPAIEDVQGYVAVDGAFTSGEGNFLLKVEGDSMIDAHIKDGDYVVVKPQPIAENGDIVAALVDNEATVKRFYRKGKQIRLEPANPAYKSIVIKPGLSNVSIVGKVVAILRSI